MKKFLALALALLMCMSMFVACRKDEPKDPVDPVDPVDPSEPAEDAATLEDAVEYLNSTYKTDEGKKTPANYKLAAQIKIGDAKFPITWTVDLDTITLSIEDGLCVVTVPAKNDTEVTYKLTATIADAEGKTAEKVFTRVLPVYDNTASVDELVEGEAYKLYLVQSGLGLTLYATGETQQEKFIKTTLDPKAALDFYAEKVEGGYKFYTTIDGVKSYVHAYTTTDAETGKVSKYICYATETAAYYVYHEDVKAWFITIPTEVDGAAVDMDYVVGTYGTYETICISESSYITPENTGLTQFPVSFMLKADAEAMVPSERPEEPTDTISITEANTIGLAKEHNTFTVEKYLVKGIITEIANTTYGNLYIADAEGNTLYVYGLYNADGSVRYDAMNPQPKVGDTITVSGILGQYNGSAQMKNGWVTELVAGEGGTEEPEEPVTPPAAQELTIPAFTEIALAQPDKGATTAEKYIVTGTITEIVNTQYGNLYIQDAEGNTLYVYGMYSEGGVNRFDAMNPQPKVGDTITIIGVASNYNGAQMKNAWIYDPNASTEEPEAPALPTELTSITVANTIAAAKEHNTYTEDKYLIEGVITEIKSTTYGNVYIEDELGNQLYIYGLWNVDGTVRFDKLNPQPKVGDTITVAGILGQYNDAPQMKNGWIVELVVGEGNEAGTDEPEEPAEPEEPIVVPEGEISIPDANKICAAQEHNIFTTEKYTVTGKVTEIANTTYGNVYITDAAGNSLYLYGLYSADGSDRFDAMDPQPQVGDIITVVGSLGRYNDTYELKNGWVTSITAGVVSDEEVISPLDRIDIPGFSEWYDSIFNKDDSISTAEANAIGKAMAHNTYTEETYTVIGTITRISNTTYGNLYIKDESGEELYVYGLYDTTNKRFDKMNPQPKVGDTITVVGPLGQYNGTPQMKNATMTELVENKPEEITIAKALEIANAQAHNVYTLESYIVTGVIDDIYNTTYGNMYITDGEGNRLCLYGLYDASDVRFDKMANKPQVGDTITVVAPLGQYNGTPQMKNAHLVD